MRARTVIIAAVVVGAFFAGDVAGAMSRFNPVDARKVIHACYRESGAVKLANGPAYTCPRGWKQISWNKTGTRGAPGAAGAPGADGTDGADGAPGAAFTFERTDAAQVGLSSGAIGVVSNAAPSGSYTVTGTVTVPCPAGGPPDPEGPDDRGFVVIVALLGPDYDGIFSERPKSYEQFPWEDCGRPLTLPPLTGEIPTTTWNDGAAGSGRVLVGASGRGTFIPTISFSVTATPAL